MKTPTRYGAEDIAELHPSITSAENFPKMITHTNDEFVVS
jgi:hypothetical protein